MIKIDRFTKEYTEGKRYCEITLKVSPIRPCNIVEEKLGKDVAENSSEYYIADDGGFYKTVKPVAITHTIERLKEMQKEAQEGFTLRITQLKESLDKFKRLQKLAKKEIK